MTCRWRDGDHNTARALPTDKHRETYRDRDRDRDRSACCRGSTASHVCICVEAGTDMWNAILKAFVKELLKWNVTAPLNRQLSRLRFILIYCVTCSSLSCLFLYFCSPFFFKIGSPCFHVWLSQSLHLLCSANETGKVRGREPLQHEPGFLFS